MIRDEAVQVIQNRLGQRTGLVSQISAELQLKQIELEHAPALPWFLVKPSTGLATAVATRTVALPADFLREHGESNSKGAIWLTAADGSEIQLQKDYYDTLKGSTWLESSGQPTHYALVGSLLYMFPLPDAVYPLTMFYYGAAATLVDSDDTNLWLANAPDLLIAATGETLAKFLRDPTAVQLFSNDLSIARQRFNIENVAREQAGFSAVMGG